MKLKSILGVLFFTTILIYGCENKTKIQTPIAKVEHIKTEMKNDGVKASDFELESTKGNKIKLSDYRGKIVIVDFWATWCPPCREEIPSFVQLQNEYKSDLQILGVSLDQETKKDIPFFMQKYKMNYPVLFANYEIVNNYGGIEAIPTTFVIDQNGNIINSFIGYHDKSVFVAEIERLLKKS